MQITFHGAAQTVTGSRHLIEVNGHKILLDCGLYQGRRQEAFIRNRNFGFDPTAIDAVVLSHAHIDHSGNIPSLTRQGYDGPIYATHATRDLCGAMLLDSAYIQERDAEFVNKKRKRKGEPAIEPLYTEDDALKSLRCFESVAFHRTRELFEGVHLTFYDAGHMLGSAFVVLDIEDRDAERDIRLVFSGDLGRENLPILRDPETIDHADILIMESTYGGRLHEPIPDTTEKLKTLVNYAITNHGALLIPAFAVGRTQQIVYELQKLHSAGEIPLVPIFVDSPLAIDVTEVFRTHPDSYDEDALKYMAEYNDDDIFGFKGLRYTRKVEESKALNTQEGPFVVIAASGMIEHGRILHHLRNRIDNPSTVVLITGWQAEHTLGRKLIEGVSPVRIFGEEHYVNARVEVINGLSGHGDEQDLVNWVGAMKKKPQRTFLVHGEVEAATALAGALNNQLGLEHVHIPALHEVVDFPEV